MRSSNKAYLWDTGPLGLSLGNHVFRYALYPHKGDWREAGSVLEAYRRNNAPRAFVLQGASSESGRSYSALSCEPANVLVSVLEKNGNGEVLLRLWETAGRDSTAELGFGWDVKQARKTDLLERELEELSIDGRRLTLPLEPFEIATLLLQ
jgi:alpha-mannosidase